MLPTPSFRMLLLSQRKTRYLLKKSLPNPPLSQPPATTNELSNVKDLADVDGGFIDGVRVWSSHLDLLTNPTAITHQSVFHPFFYISLNVHNIICQFIHR